VEDIQELDADHYLTVFRRWGTGGFHFLDEQFAGDITFIEYKGDVFDVMTTIDDYTLSDDVVISPNPAMSGGTISITGINENRVYDVELLTATGITQDMQSMSANRYVVPKNLPSGMYYLRMRDKKDLTTIPLYIK